MIAMAAANAPLSALGSITIIIVGVIFYRHFENSK